MFCRCVRWLRLGWPARGPCVKYMECEFPQWWDMLAYCYNLFRLHTKYGQPGTIFRQPREWSKMFDDVARGQLSVQLYCCVELAQLRRRHPDHARRRRKHLHVKHCHQKASNSCLVTVAPVSAVGRFLLQARWSGTHFQIFYVTLRFLKTHLGDL